MITKVVPTEEVYNGFVGDNVTIECYAKGSPVPYLTINSKTTLAPDKLELYCTYECRLMMMSPLYPCGKPCSTGTHNGTVKKLNDRRN
eukprot:Seg4444.2 transcript_id=Seg4444.2/GoldUCD/mRNA.D3Y31 product="hypothetical protein" pseudo=true protein_id=Seg4444.2/GoldUCD/D3Y31